MEQMTITEALAEIKLIEKKIEKKEAMLTGNVVRAKHVSDPFEKDGGSLQVNQKELQSVSDLQERHVGIRRAIAAANLANTIKIGTKERSITDWLVFKREVLAKKKSLVTRLQNNLKAETDGFAKQPRMFKDEVGNPHILEIVPNFDYPALLKETEGLQEIEDKLDGQLSLKNATIVISI